MSSQGSQGYQRPGQRQQQAAWGAPGDYAAQAYTQYGYGYKDGYAVPQVAQVPQVQGYYVQGSPGWDGFGGFGYPGGQQAAAAAAYAAAQGYAQPGYGLYGSAFGPVYGQPQQAYAGIPRALPPQSAPAPPGVQNMAPGSRPAPRAGAAVGAPVGTKPVGSGPGTDLDRKQNAGATGNDLEVEIEGGFKSLNTPNGADARLSSSTSIGSELGKDVSGPYEATPGANKSPFGPGVFFGGMGYNDFAREKEDGQEDEEWKEYEARFGIEDLIGGLGGAAKSVAGTEASPERLFTGANVGPATSSSITSGPPPGLGPAANTSIGRNGSLSDLASTTGSAVVDDTAVPAAAKDAGFQLPSWGTSIGALGGALVAEKAGYDVASNLAQLSIDAAPQMVESVKDEIARPAVSAVGAAIAPVQSPVAAEAPKPIPAPATDEPRKPMSWAAIAKTPAKPSEVKPAGPVVQKPATWAAAAKAPAAPIPIGGGPGRRLVGNEDPKSLVAEMFAERGINPKTFNVKPVNAKFFVIKSYTEDDVHKSLKYSIWASTEIGNRRLDAAFMESAGSPIYLFFSVNASGHFCGVAEMLTRVDWNKNSSVWAQDGKWKGVFAVKWIFVKDVPNSALRHLRVASNENKPVTNSRDTQELPPDVGREMLRIFLEYRSRTCIMDDWNWYDERENMVKSAKAETVAEDGASPASTETLDGKPGQAEEN